MSVPPPAPVEQQPQPAPTIDRAGGYAWYVLIILMIVYALNFIDRQVITILAADLKKDLNLADTEIGLLFGTVFALFFAIFGVPLGKLADGWVRTRMIALGLGFWSLMTALSGFAWNFTTLALARTGVGIGEASASPAAYSLLSDYFPKRQRATALAIYSSGIYIGAGVSLIIGGFVLDWWHTTYGDHGPLGLRGWQATFLIVGVPGILLALLVAMLREPVRGAADGIVHVQTENPVRAARDELFSIVPPLTFVNLARQNAPRSAWVQNILAAIIIVAAAWLLTQLTTQLVPVEKVKVIAQFGHFVLTSHGVQWIAMAVGFYGIYSWQQMLALRDAPSHHLIWRTPLFAALTVAGGLTSFASYGIGAFLPYYAVQNFKLDIHDAGLQLGAVVAVSGWVGTVLGGLAGDFVRKRRANGRILVALFAVILPLPIVYFMFTTSNWKLFVPLFFVQHTIATMWLSNCATTLQDIVMPRMRGIAAAVLFIGTTMIGLGCGPYFVGLVSDMTGSLRTAILSTFLFAPITIACLVYAARKVDAVEQSRLARARAAGENV